ncbi:hypothetical protein PFISCL1PPCAC_1485, partial [Pristionchus fissidentatus]
FSRFVIGRMIIFCLLLVPFISAADPPAAATADLGFTCDVNKCVFSLEIPQTSVEFVNVALLQSEIASLNANLTELQSSENLIHTEEGTFNNDLNGSYVEVSAMLNEMFDLASTLNQTCNDKLVLAVQNENKATSLYDTLSCIVKNGLPATCNKGPTAAPPTKGPDTTDDGSTHEPVTKNHETEEPFTGTTTTAEPFTGTTTTPAPYTGSTTTVEPFTGSTTGPEANTDASVTVVTVTDVTQEGGKSTISSATDEPDVSKSTEAPVTKESVTDSSTSSSDLSERSIH